MTFIKTMTLPDCLLLYNYNLLILLFIYRSEANELVCIPLSHLLCNFDFILCFSIIYKKLLSLTWNAKSLEKWKEMDYQDILLFSKMFQSNFPAHLIDFCGKYISLFLENVNGSNRITVSHKARNDTLMAIKWSNLYRL